MNESRKDSLVAVNHILVNKIIEIYNKNLIEKNKREEISELNLGNWIFATL